MDMRTLVTGVTGRVGSRFAPRLAAGGAEVRVLVRDPAQVARWWDAGFDVMVGDLADPDAVKHAVADMAAVVHLAAAFRHAGEEEIFDTNREATIRLARAALDAGVPRFLYASTTLVYGPGRGRPLREEDEPAPAGAYPASKAAAERALLRMHAEHGLGVRVARLAFVYGEGDPHLSEFVSRARQWPSHQRLHLVHHADVAQGLGRILAADGIDGRVYNVADDAPVTAWELLALAGEEPEEGAADRPLADPWAGIADTGRIRAELGYRPEYPTVYTAGPA
jgi:nucleoside-diphosphate-sugar epimerase